MHCHYLFIFYKRLSEKEQFEWSTEIEVVANSYDEAVAIAKSIVNTETAEKFIYLKKVVQHHEHTKDELSNTHSHE